MSRVPYLSVVMPVLNGESVLPRSLPALLSSALPRDRWELIVVDDGSTDGSRDLAVGHADVVVDVPHGPRGPAAARNHGARRSRGEVLVFIDADIVVHDDTLSRFEELFESRPQVDAAFGAYDLEPAQPDFLSQYRNLYHRYVHVRGAGEAGTFWAGCGAVRRSAFLEVGMYDEVRFPRPQIEDIELGYRLRARGHRIVLDPTIQGKHLKKWSFTGILRTDLLDRGVPWARLILEGSDGGSPDRLNVRADEKVKTGLVGLGLVLLVLAAVSGRPLFLLGTVAAMGSVVLMNAPLYRWFARLRGWSFALRVVPLNLLYYLISGMAVITGWARHAVEHLPGRSVRERRAASDEVPEPEAEA